MKELYHNTPTMTSYPKDLSSSPTAKTPMGSLVIKKCTRTLTFEEYTSSCTGSCSGQQRSFKSQTNLCQANKDDGICLRKIHQCQGLVCLCCDHVTCFPTVSHGEKFQDHLHPEDLHVLHLSNVRKMHHKGSFPKALLNLSPYLISPFSTPCRSLEEEGEDYSTLLGTTTRRLFSITVRL